MIKVSVLYANRNGATFDMDYYCNRHIVLVRQLLGDAVKGLEVDQGVASSQDPAPFIAIGHLWFDSVEDFQAGLAAHGPRDHGGYSELHECPARHSGKRGQSVE